MNHSTESKRRIPAAGRMCIGVLAASLGVSACIDTSSSDATSDERSTQGSDSTPGDGAQTAEGEATGSGMGMHPMLSVVLPGDISIFPPGPPMPLSDAEAVKCMPCHDGVEAEPVAELQGERSPNFELVNHECVECHSADYALSQPPMDKAEWQTVVKKMGEVFDSTIVNGVPVVDVMFNPVHQDVMATYLAAINGK